MKPLWIIIFVIIIIIGLVQYIPWVYQQWNRIISWLKGSKIKLYTIRIWASLLSIIISSMILLVVSWICISSGSFGSNISCSIQSPIIDILAQRGYLIVFMSVFILFAPIWIYLSITIWISIFTYNIIKKKIIKIL